jgi:stage V sporulation protein S
VNRTLESAGFASPNVAPQSTLSLEEARSMEMLKVVAKSTTTADVLKVAAKSNPTAVAGALAGVVRERGTAELQAIGAAAINQAVKAIAIARGYVAPSGLDLVCVPAFADVQIDGQDRTAIKLIVSPR